MKIPAKGIPREEVLERLEKMREGDSDWKAGKTFAYVYHAGEEHSAFLKAAHNKFFSENALNPIAFQSLKRMETEVIQMTAAMLNGDDKVVGTVSSGGTESILLAVKAYRDRARKKKPWILRPEMIVPRTVHAAFDKAADYFGVRIRYIETDDNYRVNPKAVRSAIGRNTILVVGSAPQFPQGVIDPIEELGEICQKKKIPLHVDACIGGFILPFIEKIGRDVRPWDFRVPGVTSISADLHKYGYTAKGASAIVYRSMDYLKYQFHVTTTFPGGIYASPNMSGTRPGGPIAGAWAGLQGIGEDGYMELTRKTMEAVDKLVEGINAVPGVRVAVPPDSSLVCYVSDDKEIDIFAVGDQLEERGWCVDRQQDPSSLHCSITAGNINVVDDYLKDLRESVEYLRAHPEIQNEGKAPMYGMMAKVPFRGLVKTSVLKIMESMYSQQGVVPDLSDVGSGDDDGMLLNLMNKYGDSAMQLLDKLQSGKEHLQERLTRLISR